MMDLILFGAGNRELQSGMFGFGAMVFVSFLYGRAKLRIANQDTPSANEISRSGFLLNRHEIELALIRSAILLACLLSFAILIGVAAEILQLVLPQPAILGLKSFVAGYLIVGLLSSTFFALLLLQRNVSYVCLAYLSAIIACILL